MLIQLLCSLTADAREPREKVRPEDPAPWETQPMNVRVDVVRTLIDQGDPQRALELIASFHADGIEDPELTLMQGVALRETGLPEQAERALLAARSGLGRDARPSAELCVLYADLQRLDDAMSACDRSVALDRENPRAWNNYGWLLLAANQPVQAIEAFEEAIAIDGADERYRNNLGFALVAAGRLNEAERTFRASGSHADAAYNVGVALVQAGRAADAPLWFRSAVTYDPSHGPARDALASLNDTDPAPGAPVPAEETP
jgi:Flp pilus assembly protein TadD